MMTDDVTIPVDVAPVEIAQERRTPSPTQREVVFDIRELAVTYGPTTAISGVDLEIYGNLITGSTKAIISARVSPTSLPPASRGTMSIITASSASSHLSRHCR